MADEVELQQAQRRLCDFLRARHDEIIRAWKERVRSLSPARDLSDAAIIDHLPQILSLIADSVEAAGTGRLVALRELPQAHALDRLGRGFDLDQIVIEYGLLRRAILDRWESDQGPVLELGEVRSLDAAFDELLTRATQRYASAREKLLIALDRVSEAALVSADVEPFLHGLVAAMLHGAGAVDTCVVLLREGEILRVRAAVGLEQELRRTYTVSMHGGFAGRVATEGHPVFLRDASTDPAVTSPVIKAHGVHALYGVPMIREGRVIGVAHIGSLTAFEFSEEDKLLFRTMVSRATSGVIKAQILADLQRSEAAQRVLSQASKRLAESLDYETTLTNIAHLAVPIIADWCLVDLLDNGTIRRISLAHAEPEKEGLARELEKRYPVDPASPIGVPNVLRTGRPEWREQTGDADLAAAARDAEHLRTLRELGLKSYIIVPIVVRDETVGAITLVNAESGRRYSETDLRIAEDLAQRAGTAIENARLYDDARKAVAARERVLAIVSHDLRNQLNVIAVGAELLARRAAGTSVDVGKPIETIRRTTTTMQQLVGDLLDMASIEAGTLSFEPEIVDIGSVVEEACRAYDPLAHASGMRLKVDRPSAESPVRVDRKRILQVLGNLLANAIKFSDRGTIVLAVTVGDTEVTVSVSDEGQGIPPENRESIFEPFRTGQDVARTGTGLGLYISRGIVRRHGGRLWVESELGTGSTFFFTLPRAE